MGGRKSITHRYGDEPSLRKLVNQWSIAELVAAPPPAAVNANHGRVRTTPRLRRGYVHRQGFSANFVIRDIVFSRDVGGRS